MKEKYKIISETEKEAILEAYLKKGASCKIEKDQISLIRVFLQAKGLYMISYIKY